MNNEQWREVLDCDGWYRVSSHGRVLSLCRRKPKILAQGNVDGYRTVRLYFESGTKSVYVHKLVAEAFISRRKPGMQVNHKSGVRDDNRVENLEWMTGEQNKQHAVMFNSCPKGEKCHLAKLTRDQVRQIRADRELGVSGRELARRFKIERTTIYDIVRGRSWSWLT